MKLYTRILSIFFLVSGISCSMAMEELPFSKETKETKGHVSQGPQHRMFGEKSEEDKITPEQQKVCQALGIEKVSHDKIKDALCKLIQIQENPHGHLYLILDYYNTRKNTTKDPLPFELTADQYETLYKMGLSQGYHGETFIEFALKNSENVISQDTIHQSIKSIFESSFLKGDSSQHCFDIIQALISFGRPLKEYVKTLLEEWKNSIPEERFSDASFHKIHYEGTLKLLEPSN